MSAPSWGGIFGSKKRKISVLIVDDEEDIRTVVRSLLEGQQFDPIWEAVDGEEALDAAYRYKPDLILLDYLIPKLDGEAVTKGFRLLAPDSKVLVVSGVLHEAPDWSDGFLDKMELGRLRHVLELAFGPDGDW
jgi:PleD family two-component response regulator